MKEQLMFWGATPLWFKKIRGVRFSYRHLEFWDYVKNIIPIIKNYILWGREQERIWK